MAGDNFSRMSTQVKRGLSDIRNIDKLTPQRWQEIRVHFDEKCIYCLSKSNLVKDHLFALIGEDFEASGIIVPSCQPCNDSKGKKNWKVFVQSKSSIPQFEKEKIIEKIEQYIFQFKSNNQNKLTSDEERELNELYNDWEVFRIKAFNLKRKIDYRIKLEKQSLKKKK